MHIAAQRASPLRSRLRARRRPRHRSRSVVPPLRGAPLSTVDSDQGILLLLREGASTSIGDTKGRSPLLIAAETGNLASLKALPLAEGLKARVCCPRLPPPGPPAHRRAHCWDQHAFAAALPCPVPSSTPPDTP